MAASGWLLVHVSAFTEAYETANLRTRTAWSYGYKNPRTTTPSGENAP